jgi:FkbM family methyltransferase
MGLGRSLYLDFGANAGDTISAQMALARVDYCWGFEPNPVLAQALRLRFEGQNVEIVEMAAWVEATTLPLYLGHPLSSTLLQGKVGLENYPEYVITYDKSVDVQTFDTAAWLRRHVDEEDTVVVKMDIEGAEYRVLPHLLATGAIDLIDELRCEFHPERFPSHAQAHTQLLHDLGAHTRLVEWA